jgi:hypothetical protein
MTCFQTPTFWFLKRNNSEIGAGMQPGRSSEKKDAWKPEIRQMLLLFLLRVSKLNLLPECSNFIFYHFNNDSKFNL